MEAIERQTMHTIYDPGVRTLCRLHFSVPAVQDLLWTSCWDAGFAVMTALKKHARQAPNLAGAESMVHDAKAQELVIQVEGCFCEGGPRLRACSVELNWCSWAEDIAGL